MTYAINARRAGIGALTALATAAMLLGWSAIARAQTDVLVVDGTSVGLTDEDAALDAVTYPIAELGSCASRQECFSYCDMEEHRDACLAWAEEHGVVAPERAAKARAIRAALAKGRLECGASIAECRAYCEENDCSELADIHGLWTKGQLMKRERMARAEEALASGDLECGTTVAECRAYCEENDCDDIAAHHGIWSARESEEHARLKRARAALASGELACGTTVAECRAYCEENDCSDIAELHGIWSEEQRARREAARAAAEALGCDTLQECKRVCEEDPASCEELRNITGIRASNARALIENEYCADPAACRALCEGAAEGDDAKLRGLCRAGGFIKLGDIKGERMMDLRPGVRGEMRDELEERGIAPGELTPEVREEIRGEVLDEMEERREEMRDAGMLPPPRPGTRPAPEPETEE